MMSDDDELSVMQEEKIGHAAQVLHEYMMANDGAGVSLHDVAKALDAADLLIHPTEAALLQNVRDGNMTVSGRDGQLNFRLTEKGGREAAELIHRIATGTEDDER